jgi:hypothetical protein
VDTNEENHAFICVFQFKLNLPAAGRGKAASVFHEPSGQAGKFSFITEQVTFNHHAFIANYQGMKICPKPKKTIKPIQ